MSDSLTLNPADVIRVHKPGPGMILALLLPAGVEVSEGAALAEALRESLDGSGACGLVLPPGYGIQEVITEDLLWMALNGLALRGYPVEGSDRGEVRFRILHPKLGQLSDAPSWLEAIQTARRALSPSDAPPPPTATDSEAALESGFKERRSVNAIQIVGSEEMDQTYRSQDGEAAAALLGGDPLIGGPLPPDLR